jgi:predicted RNase H-like HicB family nuclease
MKYKVVLYESEEGFAVGCLGLPGCWSQGDTEDEALENIRDAIREYLEVVWEEIQKRKVEAAKEYDVKVIFRDVEVADLEAVV